MFGLKKKELEVIVVYATDSFVVQTWCKPLGEYFILILVKKGEAVEIIDYNKRKDQVYKVRVKDKIVGTKEKPISTELSYILAHTTDYKEDKSLDSIELLRDKMMKEGGI